MPDPRWPPFRVENVTFFLRHMTLRTSREIFGRFVVIVKEGGGIPPPGPGRPKKYPI